MPDWLIHFVSALGGASVVVGGAVVYVVTKVSTFQADIKHLKESHDRHVLEDEQFQKEERAAWQQANTHLAEIRGANQERDRIEARQSRPR